MEIDRVMKTN